VHTKEALQIGERDTASAGMLRVEQLLQEDARFLPRDHRVDLLASGGLGTSTLLLHPAFRKPVWNQPAFTIVAQQTPGIDGHLDSVADLAKRVALKEGQALGHQRTSTSIPPPRQSQVVLFHVVQVHGKLLPKIFGVGVDRRADIQKLAWRASQGD